MAPITYNITDVVIEEGAMFIFSSWICIANGMRGFSCHLAGLVGPFPHSATSFEAPRDLVDKIDNLKIALTTTQVRITESKSVLEPSETQLPGVTFRLHDSAIIIRAEYDLNSTKNLPG
jgi:hypothetical protein